MPKHADIRADEATILILVGAPDGAALSVDGVMLASQSGDGKRYVIAPGTRHVEVFLGGNLLYERDVFIQEGTTREIRVGS
jgi:hypothetical protein